MAFYKQDSSPFSWSRNWSRNFQLKSALVGKFVSLLATIRYRNRVPVRKVERLDGDNDSWRRARYSLRTRGKRIDMNQVILSIK